MISPWNEGTPHTFKRATRGRVQVSCLPFALSAALLRVLHAQSGKAAGVEPATFLLRLLLFP